MDDSVGPPGGGLVAIPGPASALESRWTGTAEAKCQWTGTALPLMDRHTADGQALCPWTGNGGGGRTAGEAIDRTSARTIAVGSGGLSRHHDEHALELRFRINSEAGFGELLIEHSGVEP